MQYEILTLYKYKLHVFMKDSNMLATSEGKIGGKDDESKFLTGM